MERNMKLTLNKILITGGASGIGLGLTRRFMQEGNTVIACGRREASLQESAAALPGLITRRCDLAVAEKREALYEWIAAEHGDLNVLVNNAGMQQWMNPADKDFYARARSEIEVDVEAPSHPHVAVSRIVLADSHHERYVRTVIRAAHQSARLFGDQGFLPFLHVVAAPPCTGARHRSDRDHSTGVEHRSWRQGTARPRATRR
jgi:NAD(P)-dependent dehydrogenase (short-subunit alcohol dehydrogenase family)